MTRKEKLAKVLELMIAENGAWRKLYREVLREIVQEMETTKSV